MEMITVTMVISVLKNATVTTMMKTAGMAVMIAWEITSAVTMEATTVATTEVITAVTTEVMVTMVIFALKNANATMMTKTAGMFASNAGTKPKEIKATMMVLTTVPTKASSLELIANVNVHTKILLAGRPAMSASIVYSAKMMTTVMRKITTAAMATMAATMVATMVATMEATMVATMEAMEIMAATMEVITAVTTEAMVTMVIFALKNANVTMMTKTAGMFAFNAGTKQKGADLIMAQMANMAITATNASTSATAITMMKTAGMAAMTAGKKLTAVMMVARWINQNVKSPHAMTIVNGGMKNAGKRTIGVSEFSELWLECHNS